ncbi:hypothetical protein H5P28_01045 [Ruficoccus amylovorans]|uniref:Uncharacterized protein n=1 Tax=Ruficoccus amylovorans TaxID=1804625 RepID=A0A842H9A7_9BACT|nr:hypothetical protein [Ruficoccus amylovorans]MBC2592835.1 hypothetical protein [Ruficoccus amylovorans]
MVKPGPKLPADRGPRTRKVTIYLTDEEADELERVRKRHGFKSSSALLAFIIEPLAKDYFTGAAFWRLGVKFADMVSKLPKTETRWKQMIPFHKLQMPEIETVNAEQDEATEKDSDK